jgi:protein-tyrosine-phosphatase
MAESVARQHASDIIEASSAGLYPLGRIAAFTEHTLVANGYPIGHLSSKPLGRRALEGTDLVINLSGTPLQRYIDDLAPEMRAEIEQWGIEDPYGKDPATYQRILEEIESRVLRLASQLRDQQRKVTA